MSDGIFPNSESPEMDFADQSDFELSDFIKIDEYTEDHPASMFSGVMQNFPLRPDEVIYNTETSRYREGPSTNIESGQEKREVKERVAFKTRSEIENLDDGFKWRKYGKKMVKNSPNPRNYYRCSVEGCPVKKRVERDREDPGYVITTYEGVHNHLSPF